MRYVDKVKDHFWLDYRNTGASLKLVGNVTILTVFVEDETSKWDKTSKQKYWSSLNTAIDDLTKAAASYGTKLNLKHLYFDMSVPSSHKGNWKTYYPEFFHRKSMCAIQEYYEASLKCDETPFIFAFNCSGRGFAQADKGGDGYISAEFSAVFSPFKASTIMHELLHQYGARDYYFPKWIADVAVKYYPSSVMLSNLKQIDDLTAYLIGWKDDISATSYNFLKETMGYTYEQYVNAVNAEWAKTNNKK